MSIEYAIAKAGTQKALAESLGVKQPVVAHWKRRGWCPIKRAMQINQLYGIPWASLIKPELRAVL